MSILSNADLEEVICFDKNKWNKNKEILINNGEKKRINPMGYDLRVGKHYFYGTVDERSKPTNDGVRIKPGDLVLIRTLEEIRMPEDGSISALILSKVTQVCRGLSNVSTKIDAGYSGKLIISIQNVSKRTIHLKYGEEFCTIIFITNKSVCSDLYDIANKEEKYINAYAEGQQQYVFIELVITLLIALIIIGLFVSCGYYIFGEEKPLISATIGLAVYNSLQEE
jgi:dCTP deaminase